LTIEKTLIANGIGLDEQAQRLLIPQGSVRALGASTLPEATPGRPIAVATSRAADELWPRQHFVGMLFQKARHRYLFYSFALREENDYENA
jgi:hypothetical protein